MRFAVSFESDLILLPAKISPLPPRTFIMDHFVRRPIHYRITRSQSLSSPPALSRSHSTLARSPLQSRAIYDLRPTSNDTEPTPFGVHVSRFLTAFLTRPSHRPFPPEKLPFVSHCVLRIASINDDHGALRNRLDRKIELACRILMIQLKTTLAACESFASPSPHSLFGNVFSTCPSASFPPLNSEFDTHPFRKETPKIQRLRG